MAAHLSIGFFEGIDFYGFHKSCAREGLEVRNTCVSMPGVPLMEGDDDDVEKVLIAAGYEVGLEPLCCAVDTR